MRYSGLFANVPPFPISLKRVCLPALALILISSFTVLATTPTVDTKDEIKKLIQKATKLRRAGSFDEAEKLLLKAVDLDNKQSEAKVELAYILVKERRTLEAYNLVFQVALAERQNAHAFAVLGMSLLTAGRFKDARTILYQALQLNKKDDLAWAGFGLLEFCENHISDSLANLQTAVSFRPDEPDYLFALGQVSA